MLSQRSERPLQDLYQHLPLVVNLAKRHEALLDAIAERLIASQAPTVWRSRPVHMFPPPPEDSATTQYRGLKPLRLRMIFVQ